MATRFTLEQLRAFERVARLGSFSATATHLNLTQPSVSLRVRELETAIGADLFVRRGPRIGLTAAGRTLLDYVDQMQQIESEIASRFTHDDPLHGMLRLGATDSFALVCLPPLLRRLEQRHPRLKVSVNVDNSTGLSRLLNERELDIAVVSEPTLAPHVGQRPAGYNELAWVGSPKLGCPISPLSAEDLVGYHIMLTPPPSRLHDTVIGWFTAARCMPERLSTCDSLSVIISNVIAGVAIAVVPVSLVRKEIANNLLRRIDARPQLRPHSVSICYQRDWKEDNLAALASIASELIKEYRLFLSHAAGPR